MPLTIPDGSSVSLETLKKALFNEALDYKYTSAVKNRSGEANAVLIGGNLTLLVMMAGSVSEQDYSEKILFLEDVGEYLYSLDRMMWNLKRSGKLTNLKGLIVGSFSEMKDNDIPFGQTAEQIIMEHVKEFDYPVCFNFPAGHINDNRALIFGRKVNILVEEQSVSLTYPESHY
jgi:muramoyltetrapeptide carboxypeptidase